MAKQTVNIGSYANDGSGDKLRVAFDKINDNFTEVYDAISAGVGATGLQGGTGATGPQGETGATGPAGTANTGNITFSDVTIKGATTAEYPNGLIELLPNENSPDQSLKIYPTAPPDAEVYHTHLMSSDYGHLFLGDDLAYVARVPYYQGGPETVMEIANFRPVVSYANGISVPDERQLNVRYGWDSNGLWFTGSADTMLWDRSYPIELSATIDGTNKMDLEFVFVQNDNCSDPGVAIFKSGDKPLWFWGQANTSRIAVQVNCTGNLEINGTTSTTSVNIDSLPNGNYRIHMQYDPNNEPHVSAALYNDDTDDLVASTTLNDLLEPGIYAIGFAADQDNTNLKSYIKNVHLTVNDGAVFEQTYSMTDGDSGWHNRWQFTGPNIQLPPNGDILDSTGQPYAYRGLPQNLQSTFDHYTLQASDNGKHIYRTENDGYGIVIPTNTQTPLPIGFAVTVVSGPSYCYFWADNSNETDFWAASHEGWGPVNNYYFIPPRSIASIVKIDTDEWIISGVDLGLD